MYIGEKLWSEKITGDIANRSLANGKIIRTYPNLPVSLYQSFCDSVTRHEQKIAVVDDAGKEYSYSDLKKKVEDFSAWLYFEMKIKKGDHVALMLFNRIEFSVAALALNRIGAVIVPLPTKYKEEEIHSLIEKSDVSLIITEEKYSNYFTQYQTAERKLCVVPADTDYGFENFHSSKADLSEIEADVKDSDMALLIFTSGTTSLSKGVTIRNYNVMHAIISYERTLGINEKDRAIIPVPIYLVTGFIAIFGLMMHVGGTVYLNKFFKAPRVLSDINKYGITFFHASPTVFALILAERKNFPEVPSLRMLACGSSNMAPGKIKQLHKWMPNCEFRTIYGLTESTSPGTVFPVDANGSKFIGSSGIPIPGMEIKIVDENGQEVQDGTDGTIFLKGTNITEEYYKVNTNAIHDGWLDTGDIGYVNSQGYLWIVDRKKDMINRGGEKICSFDIENELSLFEEVADSAVVGVPHALYGEAPVALVQLKPGYSITALELRDRLKKKMARFKVPEQIKIVDEIPVTKNMKVDKKKIRQMFD